MESCNVEFVESITEPLLMVRPAASPEEGATVAGFAALDIPAMPDNLWSAATALIVTALFGCGVGFVNAVLQTLFRSWDKLWSNATRLLYFFSGIFRYYLANGIKIKELPAAG